VPDWRGIKVTFSHEALRGIGWLFVHIWNNPPVLYDFQPLNGRKIRGTSVLAEMIVFMIT
jgi:hypothetical protein